GAPLTVPAAGVRGHPGCDRLKTADALARGHDLAAVARRLGDEHVARPARLALDQLARPRAADLLVGGEQVGDRQPRCLGARYTPEGIHGEIWTALHVVDAGTVESIFFAPARRGFERAERMHGIKVGEHENTGAILMRARGKRVSKLRRAGQALEADRNVA